MFNPAYRSFEKAQASWSRSDYVALFRPCPNPSPLGRVGQTSHQLDEARPRHLGADGVEAYRRDRLFSLAGCSFRETISDVTACGEVPTKTSSCSPSRIPHCFLESHLKRQFQGSCLTRSCLLGSLGGSNGLMSGNWREFQDLYVPTSVSDCTNQDSKRVFLIMSDGQPCVFTCVFPRRCSILCKPRRQNAFQICWW